MQSPEPRFSAVVPVYNGSAFLRAALESIRRQTCPPAEIIVVEDGSSFPSDHIVREFGPGLTYVRQQNTGSSAARNRAIRAATGNWIAFLDQDDIWEPDHLAMHADLIRQKPAAEVCYSARRELRQDGYTSEFVLTPCAEPPRPNAIGPVLMDRCPITLSAVSVRRDALLGIAGFDPRHDRAEDWDLFLRLHLHGATFAYCPRPTLQYRIHSGSSHQNVLPTLRASMAMLNHTLLPAVPAHLRWLRRRMLVSRLEAEAAILMREHDQPGSMGRMWKSVKLFPISRLRRYLVLAEMLLSLRWRQEAELARDF